MFKTIFRFRRVVYTFLPVGTDPVKLILAIVGCSVRREPVVPGPATMFITPGGAPASFIIEASRIVERGVYSDA